MTILYNTNFTHNPNSYITLGVARAARAVFGSDNVVVADNRSLATLAASGEHRTLLCLDGQRLNRKLIERVRPAFQTAILWLFEDPFMLDYNKSNADLFDHIMTNDPECVGVYGTKGLYLPLAASESLHRRAILSDDALEYDVFFAGTMWPNRVKTLRRLLSHFSEKHFKLVCPTNVFLPPLPRDIAARAIQWPINHESFIDFANASRITLTMFRDYASHGTVSQATAPGPRLFELGLSGTAQVVEVDPAMDRKPFDVVDGVACCTDVPGLIREVDLLLGDPALRHARASAAQISVQGSHRYDDRLRFIAETTQADFGRQPGAVARTDRKLRVLMCTHSTMRAAEWGGVEVYQQLLITALASTVEVYFWLRRREACSLTTSDGTVLEEFGVPEIGWLDCLTDANEETVFANVISQYEIDVVHFQHLGHHAASLPIIAKASGAGTIVSAHDFFVVCSRYNLLDYGSVFCDIGNRSIAACDICLRIAEGVPAGGQEVRRSFMAEMLRSVDVVLFGTKYSEDLTVRIYPGLAQTRRVVTGIPSPRDVTEGPPPRPPRDHRQPLRIAVLGNFLRSKGADTVISVIETVNPALFEFHIIGKAEPQYQSVITALSKPNVTYHGRYDAGELDILASCDVSLHLSIWPETFCISLSEAWQHRVVPIVTGIGGLGDRVTHGRNGLVVPVSDAAAVIGNLEFLRCDPTALAGLQANIGPELWGSIAGHAETVRDIYRSLMPRAKLGSSALGFDAGQVHLLPHASWRNLSPARHIFDPPRRSGLSLDLPEGITEWVDSHDVTCRVDSVAGCPFDRIGLGRFEPSGNIEVNGWTFVQDTGVSGQAYVVLVGHGEEETIFLQTARLRRDDVAAGLAGAPANAGFAAHAALHGKWSDGRYRIAIVNVVNKRARFNLTHLHLTLREGRAELVEIVVNSTEEVRESFERVTGRVGAATVEPGRALAGLNILDDRTIRYTFESIGNLARLATTGSDIPPTARLLLRGWGVQAREMQDAGELYVGLVGERDSGPLFWLAIREARPDIRAALNNLVPELSGFGVELDAPATKEDGAWRVVLCNVVGTDAVIEITRLLLTVSAARFVHVGFDDLPEVAVMRLRTRLRESLAPPRRIAPADVKRTEAKMGEGTIAGARQTRSKARLRKGSPSG